MNETKNNNIAVIHYLLEINYKPAESSSSSTIFLRLYSSVNRRRPSND